jgi:hypothetical protein
LFNSLVPLSRERDLHIAANSSIFEIAVGSTEKIGGFVVLDEQGGAFEAGIAEGSISEGEVTFENFRLGRRYPIQSVLGLE